MGANSQTIQTIHNQLGQSLDIELFFSPVNVNYLQDRIKNEIFKLTGKTIICDGSLEVLMNDVYTLEKTSSDCQKSNLKNFLIKLNTIVINKYITQFISNLNLQNYYIKDISTLPMPFPIPEPTNNKGVNTVNYNIGI